MNLQWAWNLQYCNFILIALGFLFEEKSQELLQTTRTITKFFFYKKRMKGKLNALSGIRKVWIIKNPKLYESYYQKHGSNFRKTFY